MTAATQKSIFITGGAGGMGLATGQLFADNGWFVGLFDVDKKGLEQARKKFDSARTMIRPLDVTSEDDFASAMAEFSERTGGHMDVMFNNAGIAPGAWFEEMPMATIRQIIDINVLGVIIGIRAALPLLKKTTGSLCISTSSSVATYHACDLHRVEMRRKRHDRSVEPGVRTLRHPHRRRASRMHRYAHAAWRTRGPHRQTL
jgi:NAD(P)-dependent dehydrogenase (short-subunit alcohol dehydrogenase family)